MNRHLRYPIRLVLGMLLMLGSAAAPANPKKWEFQVFLDDTAIGHHHFVVNDKGTERELTGKRPDEREAVLV